MNEDVKRESEQEPEKSMPPSPEEAQGDLSNQLAEALKQAESYKDLFLRKAAEFENFKRRLENESNTIVRFANEELLTSILPIVDDLERSLKPGKESKGSEAFYKGVELIYQKLMKILELQGVRIMETVGKEFNVEYHDALLQIPKKNVPPHTVVEEVEKGYVYRDKVLRHAKVIVSMASESDGGSSEQTVNAGPPENTQPKDV